MYYLWQRMNDVFIFLFAFLQGVLVGLFSPPLFLTRNLKCIWLTQHFLIHDCFCILDTLCEMAFRLYTLQDVITICHIRNFSVLF